MSAPAITPGFEDAPRDAALSFRAVLTAMSRPGHVTDVPVTLREAGGLNPVSVMIALSLCDHETSVWLDPDFGQGAEDYLKFHCSSPVVGDISKADFAFFADCPDASQLDQLRIGTPDYPDTSATAVIQVPGFDSSTPLQLAGPGIKDTASLQVEGLSDAFWNWHRRNHQLFPLGVDVIFAGPGALAALPRTTRMLEAAPCT
jgi:alpha-D-ribose 1-methylphosphonate 5-triphosphate synthase subunit PhnH